MATQLYSVHINGREYPVQFDPLKPRELRVLNGRVQCPSCGVSLAQSLSYGKPSRGLEGVHEVQCNGHRGVHPCCFALEIRPARQEWVKEMANILGADEGLAGKLQELFDLGRRAVRPPPGVNAPVQAMAQFDRPLVEAVQMLAASGAQVELLEDTVLISWPKSVKSAPRYVRLPLGKGLFSGTDACLSDARDGLRDVNAKVRIISEPVISDGKWYCHVRPIGAATKEPYTVRADSLWIMATRQDIAQDPGVTADIARAKGRFAALVGAYGGQLDYEPGTITEAHILRAKFPNDTAAEQCREALRKEGLGGLIAS